MVVHTDKLQRVQRITGVLSRKIHRFTQMLSDFHRFARLLFQPTANGQNPIAITQSKTDRSLRAPYKLVGTLITIIKSGTLAIGSQ